MRKVNIIEKYNTSLGTVLLTDETGFKVGDRITIDEKKEYIVRKIQLGTKPGKYIALFV